MSRAARRGLAGSLALLAAFGLVLAPALHAELHASEQAREREQALAEAFRIAFEKERGAGWYAELAAAVAEAFGAREAHSPEIEAPHRHGAGRHHHSHGPGPHGSGSLEHFALAIHAAAPPAALLPPVAVASPAVRVPRAQHLTPRYLVPEFSQGPPRA